LQQSIIIIIVTIINAIIIIFLEEKPTKFSQRFLVILEVRDNRRLRINIIIIIIIYLLTAIGLSPGGSTRNTANITDSGDDVASAQSGQGCRHVLRIRQD
jgi:hypothetical protein